MVGLGLFGPVEALLENGETQPCWWLGSDSMEYISFLFLNFLKAKERTLEWLDR